MLTIFKLTKERFYVRSNSTMESITNLQYCQLVTLISRETVNASAYKFLTTNWYGNVYVNKLTAIVVENMTFLFIIIIYYIKYIIIINKLKKFKPHLNML